MGTLACCSGHPDGAMSFRDPDGCVISANHAIWRVVRAQAANRVAAFLNSNSAKRLIQSECLIPSQVLDPHSLPSHCPSSVTNLYREMEGGLVLSHERVEFVSYPYEWTPEMLYQAGSLTLKIARTVLDDGYGLKDATPYNILFRGPEAVFIDLLSFEERDAGDPTWLPLAQFERTFLLPLLANKYLGLRLDRAMMTSRDGLEPHEIYRWLTLSQKAKPFLMAHVCLPVWLASSAEKRGDSLYQKKLLPDREKAAFIVRSQLRRLQKDFARVGPNGGQGSAWSQYMGPQCSYRSDQFVAKEAFVREAVTEHSPKSVLDIGCNTGHFSAMAANNGASVVAIDQDPVVVGALWQKAHVEGMNILPLVVDLTRPSPAIGWLNRECSSFLERARGHFDMVLALAVLHHMLVSERVPLQEAVALLAELTNKLLVIEFVGPQDPMFRRIARGRDHLFVDLTVDSFERICATRFEILRRMHFADGGRSLYLMQRR